jgi:hypothetical protein
MRGQADRSLASRLDPVVGGQKSVARGQASARSGVRNCKNPSRRHGQKMTQIPLRSTIAPRSNPSLIDNYFRSTADVRQTIHSTGNKSSDRQIARSPDTRHQSNVAPAGLRIFMGSGSRPSRTGLSNVGPTGLMNGPSPRNDGTRLRRELSRAECACYIGRERQKP